MPSGHYVELPTVCPHCGARRPHQAAPADPGAVPEPGDGAVCIVCHRLSVFDEDLELRRPTAEEEAGFAPQYADTVAALDAFRGR